MKFNNETIREAVKEWCEDQESALKNMETSMNGILLKLLICLNYLTVSSSLILQLAIGMFQKLQT